MGNWGAVMITLEQIEHAVRSQCGSWATFFRREGAGWQCILYPRHLLTEEQYQTLAARLSAPAGSQGLTAAERRVNDLRARAVAKGGGHG